MEDQFVQISKANALKAFKAATPEGKSLLKDLIGSEVLSEKVTDRIKNYADACFDQGMSPLTLSDFNYLPERDRESTYAYHQLTIIARALNEDWAPDFADSNQYKYYAWFSYAGGSGFSVGVCVIGGSGSVVGARLVFRSRDLAEYAAKQFQSIYNKYLSL